jgi:hypothetical protein
MKTLLCPTYLLTSGSPRRGAGSNFWNDRVMLSATSMIAAMLPVKSEWGRCFHKKTLSFAYKFRLRASNLNLQRHKRFALNVNAPHHIDSSSWEHWKWWQYSHHATSCIPPWPAGEPWRSNPNHLSGCNAQICLVQKCTLLLWERSPSPCGRLGQTTKGHTWVLHEAPNLQKCVSVKVVKAHLNPCTRHSIQSQEMTSWVIRPVTHLLDSI